MDPKQVKWLIVMGLALCVLLFLNLLSAAPARVAAGSLQQAATNTPTPTPTPTTLTYHSITFDGSVNTTREWNGSIEKLGAADGVQYYVTWDNTYLYAGMLGGNTNVNSYNLLIDTDPSRLGVSNSGTQDEFCGATFGVNAKPNYAIQKVRGSFQPKRSRAATLTMTPTPTSCGFDECRPSGSYSQRALTPTPEVGALHTEQNQSLWPVPAIWITWTPSVQTSIRSTTNQVEFQVQGSDIGLTDRSQPLGLYLYTCDASNHVVSAWPPSNLQFTGNVQELTSRTYFSSTDSGRAPRGYAQQWGEQTVLTATGNLSMLNGFAQFNIMAGGGSGCILTVQMRGNAASDKNNSAVRRMYNVMPSNCPGLTADLSLKYLDGTEYEAVDELNGATEAALNLYHWNGSAWDTFIPDARNANTNTVTKNGVTDFSPWTFDDASPTAIVLARLDAQDDALEPPLLLLLGSVVLIGTSVVIWKRRRA